MCARDRVCLLYTSRSHGLLKDKDENLSGADVREGLICVISVKLQAVSYTHLDVYKRQIPSCLPPVC